MNGREQASGSVWRVWLGLLAVVLACCGEPSREGSLDPGTGTAGVPERDVAARVFVVAIDGASWSVLDPLLAAGTLPNLKRLVDRGARGVLRSMEPTASAILWTTIATGKRPERHGIRSFVAETADGKRVPVTSNMRRAKAVWNIAGEAGVTVGFLGWWVSWPAEPVRGFMATDYTWPLNKDGRGFATGVDPDLDLPGRTYPPELIRELEPFNKFEGRLEPDEMRKLGIAAVPRVRGYAVRDMMLKDISLAGMVDHLLARFDPSLFAVYFDGYDAFCHIFWPAYERYISARAGGEEALRALPAADRTLGETLDRHLGRIDDCLGRVMGQAGPGDVVMVISDHGYGPNPDREPILRGYDEWIRPPHWHTLDGVIAAAGAPVVAGAEIAEASVLDVTPTILALLGLPAAMDMDGRVLEDMMSAGFQEAHPVRWVESYEGEPSDEESPLESPYDEEVLERLRSLGYIE